MNFVVRGSLTLVHLHIRNGLPLVHGDEPAVLAALATAEIND